MKKVTKQFLIFSAASVLFSATQGQTLITPSNPDNNWFTTSAGVINGINTALIDYEIQQQIYGQLGACAHGATMGTGSPVNGVEVTDFTYGTTVSVPYPAGIYDMASVPDVILGNNIQPGHDPYTEFIMAVSFVNNNTPQEVETDFFDIVYTAPGVFTVTYNSSQYLPFPAAFPVPLGTVHMDVVAQAGNLTFGKPTCDRFFTTFDATTPGTHDIFGAYGSLNTYSYILGVTDVTNTFHTVDNWQPDVAGIQLKDASGAPFDAAIFAWANQSNAGLHFMTWRPAPSATLMTDTYFPPSPGAGLNYFEYPRIDANDDYTTNSNPANSNYKAVFSGNDFSLLPAMTAWSYDNLSSPLAVDMSGTWMTTSPFPASDHLRPTVAFGPLNSQYMVVETEQNQIATNQSHILMSPVDMAVPNWLATDPSLSWSYFQVDNLGGGGGVTPPIDCSVTNFTNAVSTPCNNVTDESLVAWADYDAVSGSYNIWYKRTPYGGPFGYSYRPSTFGPEPTSVEDLKVTPNPATNTLSLKASGHYQVSNMLGQVVQTGDLYIGNHTIDVSQLPAGNYIMTFSKQGEKPVTTKFSKL